MYASCFNGIDTLLRCRDVMGLCSRFGYDIDTFVSVDIDTFVSDDIDT